MKLVINGCYGGFSISLKAARHMAVAGSPRANKVVAEHEKELRDFKAYKKNGNVPKEKRSADHQKNMWDIDIKYGSLPKFHGYGYADGFDGGFERSDPLLVSAVESLGDEASGDLAKLKVVEVPDGVEWELSEYDGIEHVAEKHRTWA